MANNRNPASRKVFISHSHSDRHYATDIKKLLICCGAQTFIDQDQIHPTQVLPDRIRDGISWCNRFLLFWSSRVVSSEWVRREYNMAYELRKKIVPYVLDSTGLPDDLPVYVYVGPEDREHGDADLLGAIFWPGFRPPQDDGLFPGKWQATMDAFGAVQATYDLELRRNGQLEGEGGALQSGIAGELARQLGMGGLLSMRLPVHGSWSYDRGAKLLTLVINASGFGQANQDTVHVRTTGRESGAIQGQDLAGRIWTLQRVSRPRGAVLSGGVYQLGPVDDDPYVTCEVCGARVKEVNINHHMTKVHS